MSRILLAPFASPGHVVPFAALAAALRGAGHETLMYVDASMSIVADDGDVRSPACWRPGTAPPARVLMSGDAAEVFRYTFFGPVVELTRELMELAQQWTADLIIGDVHAPAGGLAAQCAALPWLSLSCVPLARPEDYLWVVPPTAVPYFDAAGTRAALGLPPAPGESLLSRISPLRHLVVVTPRFAGDDPLPEQTALVGPLIDLPTDDRPRPGPGEPPHVLATTTTNRTAMLGGRAFAQRRYLDSVLTGLGRLPVSATVTLPAGHPDIEPANDNIQIARSVPHEPLLDRSAAVVCNAGWGTVGPALVRGLPLVLVPLTREQVRVARRCEDIGVALCLDADTVDAQMIADAVLEVSREERFREAATRFAQDVRWAPPIPTCVSIVEYVLSGKR